MKYAVPSLFALVIATPIAMANSASLTSQTISTTAMAQSLASADVPLKQRLHTMNQYRSAFSQIVTDAQGNIVHEAKGTLTMMRPDKLRWETTYPDETLLVADGNAVWNIDSFVEQVTIISQQQAIKDNPIVLLTSNDEDVWGRFVISKLDTPQTQYQIVPKASDGQIKSLTLTFDEAGKLVALTMLDAQEQTSALLFSNPEITFEINEGLFSVNIPQSYIIDDQR